MLVDNIIMNFVSDVTMKLSPFNYCDNLIVPFKINFFNEGLDKDQIVLNFFLRLKIVFIFFIKLDLLISMRDEN